MFEIYISAMFEIYISAMFKIYISAMFEIYFLLFFCRSVLSFHNSVLAEVTPDDKYYDLRYFNPLLRSKLLDSLLLNLRPKLLNLESLGLFYGLVKSLEHVMDNFPHFATQNEVFGTIYNLKY